MSSTVTSASTTNDPLEPASLIEGAQTDASLNDSLLAHVWRGAGKGWWGLFSLALAGMGLLVIGVSITIAKGVGMWGNNIPVGWAYGIINFVWWIGIGHAGTLISAILLLLQQKWRTSINRFAEAMTLFAVMCALLFPLIHTGRPWFALYWLMVFCNVIVPQIFWFKKARTSLLIMWVAALLVNVGMWCERFVIIVTSLHRDFLPSKWELYAPTWVDWSIYLGTIGMFSTLFLLFLKFVPAVAVTEVKELRHEFAHEAHAHGAEEAHG